MLHSQDKKRAIDKDQTLYQRSLFAELNKEDEPQEIIRFEISLNPLEILGVQHGQGA